MNRIILNGRTEFNRWLLYVLLPYTILLSYHIFWNNYRIQLNLPLAYVNEIDFYQAYELYESNQSRFDVNLRKWQTNFNVLVVDRSLCKTESRPELILVVLTKENGKTLRDHVRKTWGNVKCFPSNNTTARVLFAIGRSKAARLSEPGIEQEQAMHHDLLQFDLVEAHENNTYKVAAILNYLTERCSKVRFVAIVDDDFMIHPRNLLQKIHAITPDHYPIYVAGYTLNNIPVKFELKQEGFIPRRVYQYRIVPRYITAGTILMSMSVAKLLAFGMPLIPYISPYDQAIGVTLLNFAISPTDLNSTDTHDLMRNLDSVQLNRLVSWHTFANIRLQQLSWVVLKQPCEDIPIIVTWCLVVCGSQNELMH